MVSGRREQKDRKKGTHPPFISYGSKRCWTGPAVTGAAAGRFTRYSIAALRFLSSA